jgi:hypothetical protein
MRAFLLVLLLAVGPLASAATNSPVRELGIIASYGAAAQILDEVVQPATVTNGVGRFLQTTIDACRNRAAKLGKSPSSIGSMGGPWLEYSLLIALKERGLMPAYWQAEFAPVPNNYNDVMVWTKEHGPVILSCKTSLRERYKQADLEAVALRQHYPQAKFYLVTLDDDLKHLARTRQKIAEGELLALQAIYAPDNVDELFTFLESVTIIPAPAGALKSTKTVR